MKRKGLLFVVTLILLASCRKVDFGKLETGKPYVGKYQDNDIVVVIDQVQEGGMSGHAYLDKGALEASPVEFDLNVRRNGRGRLKHGATEDRLKVSMDDGSFKGTCGTSSFLLRPYVQDSVFFRSFFKYPGYDVVEKKDKMYAQAVPGYWSSYPDTGKSFGAIYLDKLGDMAFLQKVDLYMDLYYPADSTPFARPLLVLIHGGAFFNGDKASSGYPEMGRYFAERGYFVASINYRMGFLPTSQAIDRAGYRAIQDANAAVRFLLCHADKYQIDPDHVFVAGTSAGAITALNLAFMREEDRPEASYEITFGSDLGPLGTVGPEFAMPFNVKAVVNMWGAVQELSILANSPTTSVLSFHGDEDNIVPYDAGLPFHDMLPSYAEDVFRPMYGSKSITEKLTALGNRCEFHTCHGGGHSLHVDEKDRPSQYFYDTILPSMTRFLCEELADGVTVELAQTEPDGQWFEASGIDNVAELHWWVDGGAIVDRRDQDKVKVLFYGDAPSHTVRASGIYQNGMEFCEEYSN